MKKELVFRMCIIGLILFIFGVFIGFKVKPIADKIILSVTEEYVGSESVECATIENANPFRYVLEGENNEWIVDYLVSGTDVSFEGELIIAYKGDIKEFSKGFSYVLTDETGKSLEEGSGRDPIMHKTSTLRFGGSTQDSPRYKKQDKIKIKLNCNNKTVELPLNSCETWR